MHHHGECGRAPAGPSGDCIFHLRHKTREQEEQFAEEFVLELQRQASEPSVEAFNFSKFVFPSASGMLRITELTTAFRKPLILEGATFPGGVDFTNCVFEEEVDFLQTTFGGRDEFSGAGIFTSCTFRRLASFFAAQFVGGDSSNPGAAFYGTVFAAHAQFDQAHFRHASAFMGAKFQSSASFSRAEFAEFTHFERSHFAGAVEFQDTTFRTGGDFTGAVFSSGAQFIGTKFPPDATPAPNSVLVVNAVLFRDVEFSNPAKVHFRGVPSAPISLRAVSFLSTDVEKIVFVDEQWAHRSRSRGLAGRSVVLDERLIELSKRNLDHPLSHTFPTYAKVMQLYRRLRKNYEAAGRYAEAGDFFVGEMEMRRLDVPHRSRLGKWLARNVSTLGLYKHLSLYGESPRRSAAWAVALVVAFTALRIGLAPHSREDIAVQVLAAFTDSLAAFFQFPRHTGGVDVAERVLAAPLIGLILLSLKRNFERK